MKFLYLYFIFATLLYMASNPGARYFIIYYCRIDF